MKEKRNIPKRPELRKNVTDNNESNEALFSGRPGLFGGLSNERELAKTCPEGFKNENEWSEYAMKLFYGGGKIDNWEWKSDDTEERKRQLGCFKSVLGTFDLRHEDKEAVAGWMLSRMLNNVPKHKPTKKE